MTIFEAIAGADKVKENQIDKSLKIGWLSELDGRINHEIIDSYGTSDVAFSGYTESVNPDTKLLVAAPYDYLYIYWLVWHMETMLGEEARANNTHTQFEELWDAYVNWYIRTHRAPRSRIRWCR